MKEECEKGFTLLSSFLGATANGNGPGAAANALLDVGADEKKLFPAFVFVSFTRPNGLGAAADIGRNTLLDVGLDIAIFLGAATTLLNLDDDALLSSFLVNAPNEKGDGAIFDIGGNAALLVGTNSSETLLSSFLENEKGDGAIFDIGGYSLPKLLSDALSLEFLENRTPNVVGAVADMGGNVAAPYGEGLAEKGFLSVAVDVGGNTALELFSVTLALSLAHSPNGGNATPLENATLLAVVEVVVFFVSGQSTVSGMGG